MDLKRKYVALMSLVKRDVELSLTPEGANMVVIGTMASVHLSYSATFQGVMEVVKNSSWTLCHRVQTVL